MMYYVRCPDGSRYKVHEAVSLKAALSEIIMARVTGSVGSKSTQSTYDAEQPFSAWPVKVIASVHRVNSDNTEQQPYTEIY